MNQFQMDHQALYRLLEIKCERETVDGVLQGIREFLPEEDMLEAEQVCAYLQAPDKPTALSHHQQMVAMDKLLECAGVNFRTCCDLLRYQQMKKAGIVQPWISSCSWYILMNRRRNRMKISEYKSYNYCWHAGR